MTIFWVSPYYRIILTIKNEEIKLIEEVDKSILHQNSIKKLIEKDMSLCRGVPNFYLENSDALQSQEIWRRNNGFVKAFYNFLMKFIGT